MMDNKGHITLHGKDAEEFKLQVGKEVKGMFKGKIKEVSMRPNYDMPMHPGGKQKEPKEELMVSIDISEIIHTGMVRKGI